MSVKWYLGNSAAPITPTGFAATWTTTAQVSRFALTADPTGAAATKAVTDTVTTNPNNVLALQFIGPAATRASSTDNDCQLRVMVGCLESASAANLTIRMSASLYRSTSHISLGTTTSSSVTQTAAGYLMEMFVSLGTSIQVGDRLVVEIGGSFANAVSTSRTATFYYGNTGTSDLTAGSTSVTTLPGFVEVDGGGFALAFSTAPSGTRYNKLTNPSGAVDASGWSAKTGLALASQAVTGTDRNFAIRVTNTSGSSVSSSWVVSPSVSVTKGEIWSVVGQMRKTAFGGTAPQLFAEVLSGGSSTGRLGGVGVGINDVALSAWVEFREVFVINHLGAVDAMRIYIDRGLWSTSHDLELSAVRIEKVGDFTMSYADGDTSGWSWDGTAGLSSSSDVPPVGPEPGRGFFATC